MTTDDEIRRRNEELAQAINEEARSNPQSVVGGRAGCLEALIRRMKGLPIAEQPIMTTSTEIRKRNEELGDAVYQEARSNPESPYAGKYVGLANGQVVVIADNLNELAQRLRQIEPDPSKCHVVNTLRDPNQVFTIWELH